MVWLSSRSNPSRKRSLRQSIKSEPWIVFMRGDVKGIESNHRDYGIRLTRSSPRYLGQLRIKCLELIYMD
ncbi:hypothetical protein VPHK479_0065 [Vibrio phage K479]